MWQRGEAAEIELSENRCGPYALQLCLQILGRERDATQIDTLLQDDGKPRSLGELKRAAESLGVCAVAFRWKDVPELPIGIAPAIIPIDRGDGVRHFLTALSFHPDGGVLIADFPHPAHCFQQLQSMAAIHAAIH